MVEVASAATAIAGMTATVCTGWLVAASAGPGPMTWSATLNVEKPRSSARRAWSRHACAVVGA